MFTINMYLNFSLINLNTKNNKKKTMKNKETSVAIATIILM